MAFLCPVRIRRNKKRKGASGYASDGEEKIARAPALGRITGSASIETLVRVGLEKEAGLSPDSKMVVLQDFTPCVDDELEVKRGNVVNVLYQENDWVYVIAECGQREGFIPQSYCAPYSSQLAELTLCQKKKLPRNCYPVEMGVSAGDFDPNTTIATVSSDNGLIMAPDRDRENHNNKMSFSLNNSCNNHMMNNNRSSDTSIQSESTTPDVHPFFKNPSGRFIVLYTFIGRDENDVSVERGEFVTVLNRDDPEWFWVARSDGQEGFVPSGFVHPTESVQEHSQASTGRVHGFDPSSEGMFGSPVCQQSSFSPGQNRLSSPQTNGEARIQGSELVMLYDYKAQAPDDLSVRRGEWVFADLSDQTVDGWLWAYAPKSRKYGFIPKAYARIPAMTSL